MILKQQFSARKLKKTGQIDDRLVCEVHMLNPQAPVAQKVADEEVFRRFGGEGVDFFYIGPY